jgi:hypothetical protein
MTLSFNEAITPDGKATPQMLAYFIMQRDHIPASHDVFKAIGGESCTVYNLTQERDGFAIWLLEAEFQSLDEFCRACATVLSKAFDHEGMVRCALMFDGAYDGPESTIDFAMSKYIYGLRTRSTGSTLCMDLDVLRSATWSNLIKYVCQRS